MIILIHNEIFNDIRLCIKKWYPSLEKEIHRICRLLSQDGRISGETPYHYIKTPYLQGKVFHAGINLPKENVGKKKGARIVYIKEDLNLIKILYVGGHKDKRYDDSYSSVVLLEKRYSNKNFLEYTEGIKFNS